MVPVDQTNEKNPHLSTSSLSSSLKYTHRHVPISVAFHSDVPGFEEPVCFVENKDPQALVDHMMSYLDQMADVVFDKQMEIFEPCLPTLTKHYLTLPKTILLTSLILYTN